MRKNKNLILIIVTVMFFWLIKFYFNFPNGDISVVGIILTIASVLFGFLAGFFISELWTRYTEIRSLQGSTMANLLNIIKYSEGFFEKNEDYKKNFIDTTERCLIATAAANWQQGSILLPYNQRIGDSLRKIKIESKEDGFYFQEILSNYGAYMDSQVRLDILGKERLFKAEWFILSALSIILGFSILFLDISSIYFQIIALTFPAIIVMALNIIHDLDNMTWSKETISLEPNERIFDVIGKKRFYLKNQVKYINKNIKTYRTEKDLSGELKKICNQFTEDKL